MFKLKFQNPDEDEVIIDVKTITLQITPINNKDDHILNIFVSQKENDETKFYQTTGIQLGEIQLKSIQELIQNFIPATTAAVAKP